MKKLFLLTAMVLLISCEKEASIEKAEPSTITTEFAIAPTTSPVPSSLLTTSIQPVPTSTVTSLSSSSTPGPSKVPTPTPTPTILPTPSQSVDVPKQVVYDFGSVQKKTIGTFTVFPKAISADNWLSQLAGGRDKPIEITVYQVVLGNGGQHEELIEVKGKQDSEAMLSNTLANIYDDHTGKLKVVRVMYTSEKRLDGNKVIKESSPNAHKLWLLRQLDTQGNMIAAALAFSESAEIYAHSIQDREIYLSEPAPSNVSSVSNAVYEK